MSIFKKMSDSDEKNFKMLLKLIKSRKKIEIIKLGSLSAIQSIGNLILLFDKSNKTHLVTLIRLTSRQVKSYKRLANCCGSGRWIDCLIKKYLWYLTKEEK